MWALVTEYLLLENDELEIKDFGKFSAKNYPPRISQENNKITPAGRKFDFISIAENTSADFITFITKKLKINRPEALKLIENKIQEAKEKLQNGEKIILPQVGYLFSPDRKKITLVQTSPFSLHPDNFGFGEIPIPPKTTSTQTQPKTGKATKSPKTKEKVKKTTVKTKTPKPKKKKTIQWGAIVRSVLILSAIAAVIILMIAFYKPIYEFGKDLLTSKPDTTKVQTTKTETTAQTKPKKTQPQKTTSSEQTPSTQPAGQGSTVATTSQNKQQAIDSQVIASFSVKASIPLGTGYKKYYPIVGSFVKRENAEKFRQQLISEGFSGAVILSAGENRHRVSIGGYNSLEQVKKAREQYLAKHPGAGIWLLINQPNGN